MEQLPEKHNIPQLIQYEINNLSRSISIKEIKLLFPKTERENLHVQIVSLGNYTKPFKDLTPVLHNLFQIKGGNSNLFYEASIILRPKSDKARGKRENYSPISLMDKNNLSLIDNKNPQQNINN